MKPNMSENIREYARKFKIFGGEEIAEKYDKKAALLASRLAKKGDFERIMNGVYALPGYDQQSPEYDKYLERVIARIRKRAALPDAKTIDLMIVWSLDNGEFTIGQMNEIHGRNLKGYITNYVSRGIFKRVGPGRYIYEKPNPATRRTAIPMATPTDEEASIILAAIAAGQDTVALMADTTGLDSLRLKNVISHMVAHDVVNESEAMSSAATRSYSIPGEKPELQPEDFNALAIIASTGKTTASQLNHHHINDAPAVVRRLELHGLVKREQEHWTQSASYELTNEGADTLLNKGRIWKGVSAVLQRQTEQSYLKQIQIDGETNHQRLTETLGIDMKQSHHIARRLITENAIQSQGKPSVITLTDIGKRAVSKCASNA